MLISQPVLCNNLLVSYRSDSNREVVMATPEQPQFYISLCDFFHLFLNRKQNPWSKQFFSACKSELFCFLRCILIENRFNVIIESWLKNRVVKDSMLMMRKPPRLVIISFKMLLNRNYNCNDNVGSAKKAKHLSAKV